jgi:hypothetical protein
MRQVSVYDIATNSWFNQTTTAANDNYPPSRRGFCAVAISAPDNSSHNIYIYGGQQGDDIDDSLDDIYVLSLPSFQWIYIGKTGVPRYEHACALLQTRYLVTYGGMPKTQWSDIPSAACDESNRGLRLWDTMAAIWVNSTTIPGDVTDTYATALVSKSIFDVIGGDSHGNATQITPASGFDHIQVKALFAAPNNTLAVQPTTPENSSTSKRVSISTIAGIVVGIITLLCLSVAGTIYLLRLRRKRLSAAQFRHPGLPEIEGKRWVGPTGELGGKAMTPKYELGEKWNRRGEELAGQPLPARYELGEAHAHEMPDTSLGRSRRDKEDQRIKEQPEQEDGKSDVSGSTM